jgi:hypothetical protein
MCKFCGRYYERADFQCGPARRVKFDSIAPFALTTTLERKPTQVEQKRKLEEQIGLLLGQLVGLSKYPDVDPCEDGDVIWFEKTFSGDETAYTYAAIRANNGSWFTTASRTPNVFRSWSELCQWMGSRVGKVYKMTKDPTPIIDGAASKKEFITELRQQLFTDPTGSDT